jgi:class 3 adenylate cyclase/type II secretory pathway predicted ATPase ExeA
MKFCGMCGTRLAQVCLVCGTANSPEYRFCGMCGTALGDGASPAQSVPAPVAAPVTAPPPVETADGAPSLEGERRIATVILADVQNSTDLMEQIGSETWVNLMNQVLQRMETEIYRFGGVVDQFRGDGLVAFFGARAAHEDDPERAVLAGLAIQKTVKAYAADLAEQKDLDLKVRVGINTGEVIVTSVGDRLRHREDTAMGEAISIAARMETAAQPGTVLVSQNTYQLTQAVFKWQPLGRIRVKGVSQPMAVYQPLDPQQAEEGTPAGQPPARLPHVLTGRTEEFKELMQSIEELQHGRGRIVLVTGDKGMGKSFLLNQVRQQLIRQGVLISEVCCEPLTPAPEGEEAGLPKEVVWMRGTCRSYQQSWPYSMWLDFLRRWLAMEPEEPGEKVLARLRQQCERLWGNAFEIYYPFLAALLSLPLERNYQARLDQLDAANLQQQLFQAVRCLVESMAQRGPLVLSFLDMQWVDASSLELLDYCLPLTDSEAIILMAVFRAERSSPVWDFRHHVETEYPHRLTAIDLPPLTPAECNEMIDLSLGPDSLSNETRTLVSERSEGNPYYLQEMLHSLIDQKVLVQDATTGVWREARAISNLDLPGTLQSLLLARIDQLSADDRHVLQVAAVIGSTFWYNMLENLLSDNHLDHLKDHLTNLQREQLIQERRRVPNLGMEYAFNSPLVREVAYESLLSPQRVAYHRRIAEQFETSISDEDRKQYEVLIAYHFGRSGIREKELEYTLRAGQQALSVYANYEAIDYFTRAIELLDELESETSEPAPLAVLYKQRFVGLHGRSDANYSAGNLEAGDADAEALLPLSDKIPGEPIYRIDALLTHPHVKNPDSLDDLVKGRPMIDEALELSQKIGDRRREMFSLVALASNYQTSHDARWKEMGDRALTIARQIGDLRTEVDLLIGIGSAYGMDDLTQSKHYLEQALSISQKQNDKYTEVRLLSAISPQFERSGDYYRELVDYEQKRLKLAREVGNRLTEGHALMFCGQIQAIYLGDYASGLEMVEQSQRLWEETTSRLFPLLRMAQINTCMGNYDKALKTLEEAGPVGERYFDTLGQAGLKLVTAILNNALGDEPHLKSVLEISREVIQLVTDKLVSRQYHMAAACEAAAAHLGLSSSLPDSQGVASETTERKEHLLQALECSQTALKIYKDFGFTQIVECTGEEILFRHSLALAANGCAEEAADYLEQAYDEMMRKQALIPSDSPFHTSFLVNIRLHREITARYSGEK